MKVAVVGAGAIGGLVGGMLARSGADVHLIARGNHLLAIQDVGLTLRGVENRDFTVRVPATDKPEQVGNVDVVVLGLKAYSYAGSGPLVTPLLGPQTAIVAAQNGIPWWYFHEHPSSLRGRRIEAVDPHGEVSRVLPPGRVIGCVTYPAAEVISPGVIRHLEGFQFPVGEPNGAASDRCTAFAAAMQGAGFKSPVTNVRSQIWLKLMGNAAFNPISALTGTTMAEICGAPAGKALVRSLMEEVAAVASAVGDPPPERITIDRRLSGAERVGHHKTSMLQDLEAGKPLETAALLTAVIEIADIVDVEVPRLRTVHASIDLLERKRSNRA